MDFRTIKEEYKSIYTSVPQNLSEETEVVEQEIVEDYSADFEELTEEVIDEIVVDMLDEGYTGEEILDGFDELLEAMTPKQKEMRAKFKAQQAKDDAAVSQKKRANLRAKAVSDAKAKVKGTVKKGIEKAGAAAKKAGDDAKTAASNKVNKAKSKIAMGALKATGTKLKGKKGQDLSYSQTMTGHKSVRDKAKAAIKAKAKAKASEAGDKAKAAAK